MSGQDNTTIHKKTIEEYEREGKELTARELKKQEKVIEKNKSKLHTYYATMYGYTAEESLVHSLFSSIVMLGVILAAFFTIPCVSRATTSESVLEFYRVQAPLNFSSALKLAINPLFFVLSFFTFSVLFSAINVIEKSAQKTGHSYLYPVKAIFSYIFPLFVTCSIGFATFSFFTLARNWFDLQATYKSFDLISQYLFNCAFVQDMFAGAYAIPSIICSAIGVTGTLFISFVSFVLFVYLFTCLFKSFSRAFSGNTFDIVAALLACAIVLATAVLEYFGLPNFSSLSGFLFYPFVITLLELVCNGINFWKNFDSYKSYNSKTLDAEDQDD